MSCCKIIFPPHSTLSLKRERKIGIPFGKVVGLSVSASPYPFPKGTRANSISVNLVGFFSRSGAREIVLLG